MNYMITHFVAIVASGGGCAPGLFLSPLPGGERCRSGQQKADSILKIANEQARLIETPGA